jgi:hypothetical protein
MRSQYSGITANPVGFETGHAAGELGACAAGRRDAVLGVSHRGSRCFAWLGTLPGERGVISLRLGYGEVEIQDRH